MLGRHCGVVDGAAIYNVCIQYGWWLGSLLLYLEKQQRVVQNTSALTSKWEIWKNLKSGTFQAIVFVWEVYQNMDDTLRFNQISDMVAGAQTLGPTSTPLCAQWQDAGLEAKDPAL